jgi:hypothetical protein
MSIDNFNATGFNRNILRTVEATGGKMRQVCQLASGDLYREKGIYPRITGGGRPTRITTRFPDSPTSEVSYGNRSVTRQDYHDGQFADRADLDRMVVDPRDPKLSIMTAKFRREEDLLIQSKMLGDALGGALGATTVNFASGNIIPVGLGAGSGLTNAGFTYEKLTKTIQTLSDNNVDMEDMSNMPVIYISGAQLNDMLNDDKFINRDYINSSLVNNGWKGIQGYMGCNWVVTNILPYATSSAGTTFNIDLDTDVTTDAEQAAGTYPTAGVWKDTDSSDVRVAIATVKNATMFEVKPDIMTDVCQRKDKSNRWYAYMEMGFGAVRMEEEKVIAIPCDQSPA